MYTKITFYHDENGQPLKEGRVLTPDMVYATGFEVSLGNGERSGAPRLCVDRVRGPLEADGWNEDGRPPNTLFFIEFAHVRLLDNAISAVGFEYANLTLAGLPSESYALRGGRTKTPIADRISQRRYGVGSWWHGPISEYGPVYPQKIYIS